MVGFEPSMSMGKAVRCMLKAQCVRVQYAAQFDNIETVKRAVQIGLGVAILPEETIRREVADRTLVAVCLEGNHFRPLAVLYRKGKVLTPAMKRFIELMPLSCPVGENDNGRLEATACSVKSAAQVIDSSDSATGNIAQVARRAPPLVARSSLNPATMKYPTIAEVLKQPAGRLSFPAFFWIQARAIFSEFLGQGRATIIGRPAGRAGGYRSGQPRQPFLLVMKLKRLEKQVRRRVVMKCWHGRPA